MRYGLVLTTVFIAAGVGFGAGERRLCRPRSGVHGLGRAAW